MAVRKLITAGMLASGLACAADQTNTERLPFPSGGLLRLVNSIGEVTVEGCDCQAVEIVTAKSAKSRAESEKVHVTVQSHGNEVVVTTDYPRHRVFPPSSPLGPAARFDLRYHITVPRNARLVIDHDVGEVHVDDIRGDIQATSLQGAIILHLPENGQYAIDAKSDFGAVNSDFGGRLKRFPWLFGARFLQVPSPESQKLYLRIGYGDILILRIRVPPTPVSQ